MCAITGVVEKRPFHGAAAALTRMTESLAHRGPDAQGKFERGQVHLGHARLSIIDTSARATQPMTFGRLTLVLNGEIYNYLELRRELEALGHLFVTTSDTEVLLHAHAEWGEACLERLAGMWAYALYDAANDTVFLARDRFGIKPLYLAETTDAIFFASEIKALLAAGVQPRADEAVLASYLVLAVTDHEEQTFFAGVRRLMPGECATIDVRRGVLTKRRYYDLKARLPRAPVSSAEFAATLERSIREHLRSDVPVGTCLSGGLDSSTIAALSARELGGPGRLLAITGQSEQPETDETRYAEEVVRHCHLAWRQTRPTYEAFAKDIEHCLWVMDEPCLGPSVFMQYCVMKEAKAAGLKVLLDGQGADELLLGYERYYVPIFIQRLLAGRWRQLAKELNQASRHSRLSVKSLLAYLAYWLLVPLRKAVLKSRVRFLDKRFVARVMGFVGEEAEAYRRDVQNLQVREIEKYSLPHLLTYEDRNSMAHSIEARVPFLDHRVVEMALGLPIDAKIRDGFTKHALRLVSDTLLPKSIAWRTNKISFAAPAQRWLGQHKGRMQAEVEQSGLLKRICVRVPDLSDLDLNVAWRLYNVAVWERQFGVTW